MDPNLKQRKKRDKGSSVTPVFGFLSLLIFGAFSWFAAPTVRTLLEANTDFEFPTDMAPTTANGLLALIILVLVFAVAMMLWAMLGGTPRDPLDVPPSRKKKKR